MIMYNKEKLRKHIQEEVVAVEVEVGYGFSLVDQIQIVKKPKPQEI